MTPTDTATAAAELSATPDEGYFPRGKSLLREVHEQRLVGLFYGQRALCIGALSPLNYVGTSEHTVAKLTPFRRLVGTGNGFETIYFGTKAEADAVLRRVHRMHDRVKGDLPEDAGPFPKGTPYSAYDPALMFWTVAVIIDSAPFFYELFVRPLSPEEREALYQEYLDFAGLFGMPRDAGPGTYAEFRQWFDATLAGDTMHLTDEARYIGYVTAFEIPMPLHLQGSKKVHDFIMLGSLPQVVREHYGLKWSPGRERAFRRLAAAMRTGARIAPDVLATGWNTAQFDMVAKTERRRIERGKPTPQLVG
jgi:uncharacterized protein (DUF2236 family)